MLNRYNNGYQKTQIMDKQTFRHPPGGGMKDTIHKDDSWRRRERTTRELELEASQNNCICVIL